MIDAKEPEGLTRSFLGDDIYNSVAKKAGVEGGKGRKYYEEWRSLPDGDSKRVSIEKAVSLIMRV